MDNKKEPVDFTNWVIRTYGQQALEYYYQGCSQLPVVQEIMACRKAWGAGVEAEMARVRMGKKPYPLTSDDDDIDI